MIANPGLIGKNLRLQFESTTKVFTLSIAYDENALPVPIKCSPINPGGIKVTIENAHQCSIRCIVVVPGF